MHLGLAKALFHFPFQGRRRSLIFSSCQNPPLLPSPRFFFLSSAPLIRRSCVINARFYSQTSRTLVPPHLTDVPLLFFLCLLNAYTKFTPGAISPAERDRISHSFSDFSLLSYGFLAFSVRMALLFRSNFVLFYATPPMRKGISPTFSLANKFSPSFGCHRSRNPTQVLLGLHSPSFPQPAVRASP